MTDKKITNNIKNFHTSLLILWRYLHSERKKQIKILFVLMIFSSFAELISVGLIFPFISVLATPDVILKNTYFISLIKKLGFQDIESKYFLISITLIFSFTVLLSGYVRLRMLKLLTSVSYHSGADIGKIIFMKTLTQPYEEIIKGNSSEIISSITQKVNNTIGSVVYPVLNILSSLPILLSVLFMILWLNFIATLTLIFFLSLIYIFTIIVTRKKLIINGKIIADNNTSVIKILQESLGGIRDVIIDNAQLFYYSQFEKKDYSLKEAQSSNSFISQSPRFIIEPIGMVAIALIALILALKSNNFSLVVPLLATIAIAAQRMIPLIQQIYSSWALIKGGKQSFLETINYLKKETKNEINYKVNSKRIVFQNNIIFHNLNYRYTKDKNFVLSNINFEIKKGYKIGIIGETGSGKSTFLDLLMGLLIPTRGDILIDGIVLNTLNIKHWQSMISHVPQFIFLSDSTVAENIAFGVEKNSILIENVISAAKSAQIHDVIISLPNGYNTRLGEGGIFLSGGQRQRIGIARALYKNSEILILDEATSALDINTENELMKVINSLYNKPTIFIISHKKELLDKCDLIIEVKNASLFQIS